MEIKKRGSGNQRVARTQRRTNDSIKNPGRRHDRDAGIALQRYITPITALTGERYPDIRTRIGVPTVMNARNLPDMGRMNGNWLSEGKTGLLLAQKAVAKQWPWPTP